MNFHLILKSTQFVILFIFITCYKTAFVSVITEKNICKQAKKKNRTRWNNKVKYTFIIFVQNSKTTLSDSKSETSFYRLL